MAGVATDRAFGHPQLAAEQMRHVVALFFCHNPRCLSACTVAELPVSALRNKRSMLTAMWKPLPVVLAVVAMVVPAIVAAAEDDPFPVWWSPVLELESLDAIDARLERALWKGDSEGMRLMKVESDNRAEVRAVTCIDLETFVEAGYHGIGSLGDWLHRYQLARCHAIEMLRTAIPAKQSFLRSFALDVETVNYMPAAVALKPSCDMMCRDAVANDRRIPLSQVREILLVQIYSATEMKFWSFDWHVRLTILGFADFNRDGIDDMLVLSSAGSITGRGTWADLFLLTRDTPNDVLYVLNFDKPSYWNCQCEESYDDLEALRETNL